MSEEFLDQGFLLLRNVLTEDHRRQLEGKVEQVYAEEIAAGHGTKDGTVHLLGFLTRDDIFANLLNHPTTFPYIDSPDNWPDPVW